MRLPLLILVLAASCRNPTAPEHYEGPCTLAFPRIERADVQRVTLCYEQCPWHAAQFAAEGDAAYTAVPSC